MNGDRIKATLTLLCLVGMIYRLNAKAAETVMKDSPARVSGTLIGNKGLLAVPIMQNESMPNPIMGVGGYQGEVYVTETTRQQREEISLIQSPFRTKRTWN